MAACEACGAKAGFGKKLCEPCSVKAAEQKQKEDAARSARLAEERRQKDLAAAEARQQAEIARQQRYDAYISGRLKELHDLVDQGVEPCLYDIIVISTQSTRNGSKIGQPPDLDEIRSYGLAGWEAIATIPSTYGEALTNRSYGSTSGETWGAGIGGLVVGAYILMRFTITKGILESRRSYVVNLLAKDFPG